MHSNRKLEAAVGLFIVLGFLAALFMALQAANLGSFTFGQKTYAVTADFDNIGGLKARAAVKSAGVVVGRVRSIVFIRRLSKRASSWTWMHVIHSPMTARRRF